MPTPPFSLSTQWRIWPSAMLCVVAAIAIAAYWPGLSGDFLFDDFANLNALGRYGGVSDWDGLLRYVTSGIADPTGRPVSMLSFLIDARDWPAEPLAFKRTNLALHVLNGALLYAVLAALGGKVVKAQRARTAALLGAAIWLLHPLWASTVLYVVQRHAMLATFFVLAGILAWVRSRAAFERGNVALGWSWAVVAIPVFGLLAGLSKANGFLLPLLLSTLHLTVLRAGGATEERRSVVHARLAAVGFVWLPSILLLASLAYQGWEWAGRVDTARPWSLAERLLSQPRALVDYLHHLAVPGLDARGIFADDFVVSTGWWQPATTVPAILLIAALILFAWRWRLRQPVLSGALLFFFAGHAMESTVIPLELYFEHRNYLPAALLFWPLALALSKPGRYRGYALAAGCALVALCALLVSVQARLWGDTAALSRAWAAASPDSPRAQTFAASIDAAAGRDQDAMARLEPLLAAHPDELQYALTLLDLHCRRGSAPRWILGSARGALAEEGIGKDVAYQWLLRLVTPGSRAPCAGLGNAEIAGFIAATQDLAPLSSEQQSRNLRLKATDAMRRGDCLHALAHFDQRLAVQRRPEFAHEQVGMLATHCGRDYGLAHLDRYQETASLPVYRMQSPALRLRDRILAQQDYWNQEWIRLRAILQSASHARAEDATRPKAYINVEPERTDAP